MTDKQILQDKIDELQNIVQSVTQLKQMLTDDAYEYRVISDTHAKYQRHIEARINGNRAKMLDIHSEMLDGLLRSARLAVENINTSLSWRNK